MGERSRARKGAFGQHGDVSECSFYVLFASGFGVKRDRRAHRRDQTWTGLWRTLPPKRYKGMIKNMSNPSATRASRLTKRPTAADRALARATLPATARGLADQLQVSRQAVERILRDLVSDGRLVRGPRGVGGHLYHRPGAPPPQTGPAPTAQTLLGLLSAERFTALSELLPQLGIARTYASTLANALVDRGLVEKIRRSGRPYLRLKADAAAAAEPTHIIAANRRAILEVLDGRGALSTAEIRELTGAARWTAAKVPLKVEMQILRRQALIEPVGEGPGRPRYQLTSAGKAARAQLPQPA